MKKISIEELKKKQIPIVNWTKEEEEFIKECIKNDILASTLIHQDVFPNHSPCGIKAKYSRIKEGMK